MRWLALVAALWTAAAQADCAGQDGPCNVPLGDYHIALPDGDGPHPVVIFLHGAGGKGESATKMRGIIARGYAVIGPQGLKREGSRFGSSWFFHPDRPKQRDEHAFMLEIIEDAATNHQIDRDRVLLAGFSIGGSTTSYLACEDPDLARAYAPVAGGFWRPHPTECTGPVNLLHTHGWRDKTVPLEGRPLGGGRIYQGDIWHTMLLWRTENECAGMRADTFEISDQFWRRKWDSCTEGSLEFALHPGAHGIPRGWSDMALDWFESLPD